MFTKNFDSIHINTIHFFRYQLTITDFQAVRESYKELQEHTLGLCKGSNSLPVLAVELQNSCHLLQVFPLFLGSLSFVIILF